MGSNLEREGTIETIAGDIDPQTGTITFRARFENESGLLRNGSSGKVLLPQIFKEVVVVPTLSTYEQQGKTFVFKVQSDTLVPAAVSIIAEAHNLYALDQGVRGRRYHTGQRHRKGTCRHKNCPIANTNG